MENAHSIQHFRSFFNKRITLIFGDYQSVITTSLSTLHIKGKFTIELDHSKHMKMESKNSYKFIS